MRIVVVVERKPAGSASGSASVRDRLRRGLTVAMKARDAAAVAALRSALAAVENGEAVEATQAPLPADGHPDFAGSVAGLGAAEVPRRRLTDAQVMEILRAEVADRQAVARDLQRRGQGDRAERLRAEAGVLGSYLDGTDEMS